MINLELARRLRDAGLAWQPQEGDRFVVPDRDMDTEVFAISEMVVEVHDVPSGGRILKFNGTTEWALDSIDEAEVVWLPREDQLRDLLGTRFVRLEASFDEFGAYVAVISSDDGEQRHVDVDAERAYARAMLSLLRDG